MQLNQQQDNQICSNFKVFGQQEQKIELISKNIDEINKIIKISTYMSIMRIALFFIFIYYDEIFITLQNQTKFDESWNVIFYILASMMDFLSLLNDTATLKMIKKERNLLQNVKEDLKNKAIVRQTSIGSYTNYLSIYQVLKVYKFKPKVASSIYETIRILHIIITFYSFGQLAVYSQNVNNSAFLKCAILWIYILSIYYSNFQIDYLIFEGSTGPYIKRIFISEKKVEQKLDSDEIMEKGESNFELEVKRIYIKQCRRPFEIIYVVSIIALLIEQIFYFSLSILSLLLSFVIATHMMEIIYQKNLQNNLFNLSLSKLPYQHLSPYKILHQLTKSNKNTYLFICSLSRYSIILANLAFFRSNDKNFFESSLLLLINVVFIIGHVIKFTDLEQTKLYILRSKQGDRPEITESECSICLLECKKSESLIQLPCSNNHIFHFECMKNWFREKKECPLCRYSLKIYDMP